MPVIDRYFKFVTESSASDLHLTTGSPPMVRVHGELKSINHPPFKNEDLYKIITEIMNDRVRKEFEEKKQADFIYVLGDAARFRCNAFTQRVGVGFVSRLIPSKVLTMTDLKMPKALYGFTKLTKGLVVVTGPTGSGKSTTLAAIINEINENRCDHILTVEDPIEFVHKNKKALVNQRQIGENVDSFSDALRAALREDPDIILVGEMRDLETISLAISAAETGHLVFGTLHTSSAVKTVDRIIDAFPADMQEQIRVMLSESLKGVVAQVLLPTADGKGRVAALEILMSTPALANIIRDKKSFQIPSLIQTSKSIGMQLMDQALTDLLERKKVHGLDAYMAAVDKKSFVRFLTPQEKDQIGLKPELS
jgi:twitching motility protein PilT